MCLIVQTTQNYSKLYNLRNSRNKQVGKKRHWFCYVELIEGTCVLPYQCHSIIYQLHKMSHVKHWVLSLYIHSNSYHVLNFASQVTFINIWRCLSLKRWWHYTHLARKRQGWCWLPPTHNKGLFIQSKNINSAEMKKPWTQWITVEHLPQPVFSSNI
jgi:hypothetical protein